MHRSRLCSRYETRSSNMKTTWLSSLELIELLHGLMCTLYSFWELF